MPIYEYQCTICGHQLETMQKLSDDPLKDCPTCHQPALNKLVSAVGIQFKGTGWYKTDYSTKGKANATNDSADSNLKTESKPKEDAKPTDNSSSSSKNSEINS